MRLFNWAQAFKEQPTCKDILAKVQKNEVRYWIWLIISTFVFLFGIGFTIAAPEGNLKMHCIGVILALDGCISIAVIKIWAHVRLTQYWILWDQQNRIEGELRKSAAADL